VRRAHPVDDAVAPHGTDRRGARPDAQARAEDEQLPSRQVHPRSVHQEEDARWPVRAWLMTSRVGAPIFAQWGVDEGEAAAFMTTRSRDGCAVNTS
jgi:hypothetical protein